MALAALPTVAAAATITFDDVVGSNQVITNQYAAQGVTLGAIANPFPLAGAFPAPATLPTVLEGVQTWIDPFPSATSGTQVAVAMPFDGAQAGTLGILMQFAFDISFLSLVGNDLGGCPFGDCESVTLTAYNAAGVQIGQTFANSKLPGIFDQTFASISMSGMRYVAFNYTDTQFGFYAIDDLTFVPATGAIPEPETYAMLLTGFGLLGFAARRRKAKAA